MQVVDEYIKGSKSVETELTHIDGKSTLIHPPEDTGFLTVIDMVAVDSVFTVDGEKVIEHDYRVAAL